MVKAISYLLYSVCITSIFFSCSYTDHPSSPSVMMQPISPIVLWKTTDGTTAPEEVDSIRFFVFSAEGKFKDTITKTFPFENHSGVLSVPAGSKLKIVVEGLDSMGEVAYKGVVLVNDASDNDIKVVLEASLLTPKKPSHFICTAFSSCNYKINWTDNSSNENGFIFQHRNSKGVFVTLDTIKEDICSYLHTAVHHSEFQVYRIFAFNNSGTSDTITDSIKSPQVSSTNKAPQFLIDSAQISGIIYLGQTQKTILEIIDPNCDDFDITVCSLLTLSSNTITWTPDIFHTGKIRLWAAATDDSQATDTLFWTWDIRDTIRPVITIKGQDTIRLALNDRYLEPGATASDNVDGDISDKISISGSVNTALDGTYPLIYLASDNFGNDAVNVTRIVYVLPGSFPDKVSPFIYLIGEDTIYHTIGTKFTDPGAYALDNRDDSASISESIEFIGSVDTTLAGTYQIIYKVADSATNKAQRVRYVKVVKNAPLSMAEILNTKVSSQVSKSEISNANGG